MDEFKVGDKVITPGGYIDEIIRIEAGIYWLKRGLYAYQFELRKYEE
jgi:preprotein translocase subunit YajC